MNREEIHSAVAEAMAEEHERMRADLEARIDRVVAARALPPFQPPAAWTAGRHGAGVSVRHRNGVFTARRDTETEPGEDESWLPVLVGLARLDIVWADARTLKVRAVLSDGETVEKAHTVPMPIVRGYWDGETSYAEGDRVFHRGEWHATASSAGVEPGTAGCESHWLKVVGKHARAPLALEIDDEGDISESGHVIGRLKPLIGRLLKDLIERHRGGAS